MVDYTADDLLKDHGYTFKSTDAPAAATVAAIRKSTQNRTRAQQEAKAASERHDERAADKEEPYVPRTPAQIAASRAEAEAQTANKIRRQAFLDTKAFVSTAIGILNTRAGAHPTSQFYNAGPQIDDLFDSIYEHLGDRDSYALVNGIMNAKKRINPIED